MDLVAKSQPLLRWDLTVMLLNPCQSATPSMIGLRLSQLLTADGLADCEADRFKQRFYRLIRRDNGPYEGEALDIK
jgi:hypothetical protein